MFVQIQRLHWWRQVREERSLDTIRLYERTHSSFLILQQSSTSSHLQQHTQQRFRIQGHLERQRTVPNGQHRCTLCDVFSRVGTGQSKDVHQLFWKKGRSGTDICVAVGYFFHCVHYVFLGDDVPSQWQRAVTPSKKSSKSTKSVQDFIWFHADHDEFRRLFCN